MELKSALQALANANPYEFVFLDCEDLVKRDGYNVHWELFDVDENSILTVFTNGHIIVDTRRFSEVAKRLEAQINLEKEAKQNKLLGTVPCPQCQGSGRIGPDGENYVMCNACGGVGTIDLFEGEDE